MPFYSYQVALAHKLTDIDERGSKHARLPEYDINRRGLGKDASIYSSRNVGIRIERSTGRCAGCGNTRERVNGYCDVCRTCGANEAQCTKSRSITL
jgi:hypothetical protein